MVSGAHRLCRVRVVHRREFRLSVADADVGAHLPGFDVNPGAADADRRRPGLDALFAARLEHGEQGAGDHTQGGNREPGGVSGELDPGIGADQESVAADYHDQFGIAAGNDHVTGFHLHSPSRRLPVDAHVAANPGNARFDRSHGQRLAQAGHRRRQRRGARRGAHEPSPA